MSGDAAEETPSIVREIDWGKIIETALDMPRSVGEICTRLYPNGRTWK